MGAEKKKEFFLQCHEGKLNQNLICIQDKGSSVSLSETKESP